ncbi:MAG TPA: MFS transporter [Dehalococcoidia bacterium]|nr:MFS transporter [Dehalococcoidia bacterium]
MAQRPQLGDRGALLKARADKLYYGWWIVAAGFVNQAIAAALLQRSYGAYVVLLREEFGWSKAALSGAFSMQQVENGILGPIQGWLIDRFGPRLSMRVGVILFGAGFIAFSQVHSLTGFYVSYLMMAVGTSLGGFFPLTVVIVNWFDRKRARALSTMQMGGALGGLLVIAVAFALETYGWRATALVSGIAVIIFGLPLAQVSRQRPEDMGLVVDGEPIAPPSQDIARSTREAVQIRDFTLQEAMRTPAFWLISLGHGSALLIVSAVNVHLVLHLTEDLGYSLALASLVVTVITASQMGGTLLGGAIGDRFDKRLISVACMAGHALGLFLVAIGTSAFMVFAFAVLHGTAWGLRGPMMQAIRADYFGRRHYGSILGTSSLITMFGSIIGPLVAGFLADRTGSYDLGFTILAVLSGLGSVFFLIAKRPAPKTKAVFSHG